MVQLDRLAHRASRCFSPSSLASRSHCRFWKISRSSRSFRRSFSSLIAVRITVASASLLSGTKPRGWNEGEEGPALEVSGDDRIRSPDLEDDDAVGPPARRARRRHALDDNLRVHRPRRRLLRGGRVRVTQRRLRRRPRQVPPLLKLPTHGARHGGGAGDGGGGRGHRRRLTRGSRDLRHPRAPRAAASSSRLRSSSSMRAALYVCTGERGECG